MSKTLTGEAVYVPGEKDTGEHRTGGISNMKHKPDLSRAHRLS